MVLQHLKICMGLWVKEFMFSSPLPAKQYFNFLYFHLFFLTEKEKETKRKKICRSVSSALTLCILLLQHSQYFSLFTHFYKTFLRWAQWKDFPLNTFPAHAPGESKSSFVFSQDSQVPSFILQPNKKSKSARKHHRQERTQQKAENSHGHTLKKLIHNGWK